MQGLKSDVTVAQVGASFVKAPEMRTVLSFRPLLVGGNPYKTTSIYALILYLERKWGVWFSQGGTGAIVQALVSLFESLGGELQLSTKVEEIEVEGGGLRPRATGVRLAGGRRLENGRHHYPHYSRWRRRSIYLCPR